MSFKSITEHIVAAQFWCKHLCLFCFVSKAVFLYFDITAFYSYFSNRITADYTFNGGGGTINAAGAATPYPATITVSGVPAGAIVKSVTINGLKVSGYKTDIGS